MSSMSSSCVITTNFAPNYNYYLQVIAFLVLFSRLVGLKLQYNLILHNDKQTQALRSFTELLHQQTFLLFAFCSLRRFILIGALLTLECLAPAIWDEMKSFNLLWTDEQIYGSFLNPVNLMNPVLINESFCEHIPTYMYSVARMGCSSCDQLGSSGNSTIRIRSNCLIKPVIIIRKRFGCNIFFDEFFCCWITKFDAGSS